MPFVPGSIEAGSSLAIHTFADKSDRVRVSQAPVTPGWFLSPSDVRLVVNWAEGDWTDFGDRSNATTAAWSIGTRHHRFGTSGKVHFVLAWTEYRDRPVHCPRRAAS
jgi:hypothetical protein